MPRPFQTKVNTLSALANRFDAKSNRQKVEVLAHLSRTKLLKNKGLIEYYEVLIFLCAYPPSQSILSLAEKELTRISKFLKQSKRGADKILINSGLPFTKLISSFSHDCVRWLIANSSIATTFYDYKNSSLVLNDVLKLTLPSLERSETTAELSNHDLLEALLISERNRISFLISELSKLDDQPFIKDQVYDGLGVYLNIQPNDQSFSRACNRLPTRTPFYHNSLVKDFDYRQLIHSELPVFNSLTKEQSSNVVKVVKTTLALYDRETDPVTYLDEKSLRLYELDRGVSVAIYGMIPSRQLPLESYVGYTLFKNGFPAAYGGAWVFGEFANFGISIFETFRGGESGYMMCQLLRVYKQLFKVSYFEIEPYQFGLSNPEGIASGAFWFYYHFGFRPLDRNLLQLASGEQKKIEDRRGYRTSRRTLVKFTQSNMALNLGKSIPLQVAKITSKVTRMIQLKYDGNRLNAVTSCIRLFSTNTNLKSKLNNSEKQVVQEVALWAEAFELKDKRKLEILKQMVATKPRDLYKYQELLLDFLQTSTKQ